MQTEIEVKFLDIDPQQLRKRLKELGAKLVAPDRLMRRRNYDYPDLKLAHTQKAWIRVRDENGKSTLTYKKTNDNTVKGTQEINVTIDSFDAMCQLLETIGFKAKSYQETRRESWQLGDVEIEIDTWPWIPSFIELEGPSEAALRQVVKDLDLTWSKHLAGEVSLAYQKYYDVDRWDIILHPEITFGPVPDWLESKRKNKATK